MRTLLLAVLLSTTGLSLANQFTWERTVICDDTKKIFEYFQGKDIQEKPIWVGRDYNNSEIRHTMMLNTKTGAWTLIQFDDRHACVLGAGTDYQPVGEKI